MAVKKTIHEICQRCGKVQAHVHPDGRIWVGHNCANPVPGPPMVPVAYWPHEIIFERAQPDLNPRLIDEPDGDVIRKVDALLERLGDSPPPPATAGAGLTSEYLKKVGAEAKAKLDQIVQVSRATAGVSDEDRERAKRAEIEPMGGGTPFFVVSAGSWFLFAPETGSRRTGRVWYDKCIGDFMDPEALFVGRAAAEAALEAERRRCGVLGEDDPAPEGGRYLADIVGADICQRLHEFDQAVRLDENTGNDCSAGRLDAARANVLSAIHARIAALEAQGAELDRLKQTAGGVQIRNPN